MHSIDASDIHHLQSALVPPLTEAQQYGDSNSDAFEIHD